MLTKTDLEQIRLLIREEIQRETRKIIQEVVPPMIQKELAPLRREIDILRKETRAGFRRIDRKINIVISGFDSEILDIRKRLN